MSIIAFIWTRYLSGQAKTYLVGFIGAGLALLAAPHVTGLLAQFGIFVYSFVPDATTSVLVEKGMTVIAVKYEILAGAVIAFVTTLPNMLRVLAAKHPKSPLPEQVKSVL